MSTFSNQTVYDFLNAKSKCVEFVSEKYSAFCCNDSNDKPTNKAFEYSVNKCAEKVKQLKKSIKRPNVAEALQQFFER